MVYLNYDGQLVHKDQPLIKAANRGFKYGDGLFETICMKNGSIQLWASHMERLFEGMRLMAFEPPSYLTPSYFLQQVHELCEQNDASGNARIRLMVFRGEGNLYGPGDPLPHYIIESSPLAADAGELNREGYHIGIYKDARKQIDRFSGLKTNNYLTYSMAAIHARQQGWNDCLVLNTDGAVCESTIANLFIIKDGIVSTPANDQGCVAGVMRKHLLSVLPGYNYEVRQEVLTPEMVRQADELFLTNAVQGIKWVRQLEDSTYQNNHITKIYDALSR